MTDTYTTLATSTIDFMGAQRSDGAPPQVVKKSRFIGHAAPVQSADEAMLFIQEIKRLHPDANHNVWAYVLRHGQMRCSDDGEPQGTAGLPTLDVLTKQNLANAVVVVTRYFGGVLLGAGGLVRAYSQAARAAVDTAGTATMAMCAMVRLELDYSFYGRMEAVISAAGGIMLDTQFGQDVAIEARILAQDAQALIAAVVDTCNGRAACEIIREEFAAL